MKPFLYFLFISFIIISGCTKNTPTSPNTGSNQTGNVSLKIDKTTAPRNVIKVIAYLSRPNSDTLSGQLNLLSDSSADISFDEVATGTWHLQVDALDTNSVVIYTGETDVQVNAGFVTAVNLTLMPTGNGTGSIYINVTWGNQQSTWLDYNYNPILTPAANPSTPLGVFQPKILFDNGIYKMWYVSGYNSAKCNVWYAQSQDGIHWQNQFDHPVFVNDTTGKWDDYTVQCGAIIKKDNLYLMYYNGWQSEYGPWQIGLATSADGIHWKRYSSEPILKADSDNHYWLGVVSVINYNNKYYMYYSSGLKNYYNKIRINLATSSDGFHWTRYRNNPVLSPTESWEGVGILYPSVIYDGNRFVMIYSNTDRTKFGIAFSSDGINWNKSSKPTFSIKNTNNNWRQVNYPFFMKAGNEYRLYYTATTANNALVICLARSYNLN